MAQNGRGNTRRVVAGWRVSTTASAFGVRVFTTGRVRTKRAARGIGRYWRDDWSDSTLPVHVFLVEHAHGLCLVDAGQTAAAALPGYFPAWHPFFRLARFELSPRDDAAAQLVMAGIAIRDIRWVVLTHLHTDHVGGIGAFGTAELLVSPTEWHRAQGLGGRIRGYLPQYWPTHAPPHLVSFNGPAVGPFPSSYDVAGDGRLVMVPLPGHTPGHSALLVRNGAAQSFLCAGDAALTADKMSGDCPAIATWCLAEQITVLTSHDDAAPQLCARELSAEGAA